MAVERFQAALRARLALLVLVASVGWIAACDRPTPTESAVPPAGSQQSVTADGQIAVLVGFVSDPGDAEAALIASLGGEVTHRYRYVPVFAATIPVDQVETLGADASVAYIEEDAEAYPLAGKQITDWGVTKVDAPGAWDLGFRGDGAKVGIFDSGIDVDHPDLTVAGGIDLVGDGNGLDDCQGHGTHVAGIVGANANGNHTVGVAPRAELYSMRFADCDWAGATLSKMIQAVEWAIDNDMDVVNMSFGFAIAGLVPTPTAFSQAADAAFDAAYEAGIVLVAASGNSSTPYVGYPAAYPTVIAVGATDDADMLATFSQYGTEQELTAPGVNNLSSYLVGLGQETSLFVDTDNDRELEAIALQFAGKTRKQGLTAEAVYAGFGTAVEFEAVDCDGRTAVVSRGGGTFAEKVTAAMDAGCVAAIIHNHTPGNFNGTLGTETTADGRAWIPAASVTLEDGLYLKDQIESQTTVLTLYNVNGNLAIFSGTSMASPHAAGVAALVRGKNPGLSPDQVRQILQASSDDLGTLGWDPVFGYGRVNAKRAVVLTP
ncbi:MAG: S8 family serine peptidase [Longimicrobiales bacterium]